MPRKPTYVLTMGGHQVGEGIEDSKGHIRMWLLIGRRLDWHELERTGLHLELRKTTPPSAMRASPKPNARRPGESHRQAKGQRP
jgi:hypothetical protein